MKNSVERIQFIIDYLSAYEQKIKTLNKHGLFDAANLFELFAIEVGSLWLGQRLVTLNVGTYQYPCVDLIADDKQTFVQVSTVQDIPAKIKKTLESICESRKAEINAITCVKFIVIDNGSVDKAKDYTGNNQIGNVPFTRADDLVTTKDILERATSDLDFQIALHDLLKKESESISDNSEKLYEAIEKSKSVGLANIDCKINNEYEIPRDELISRIVTDNRKYISIQGEAGSGKSVLCKMLVENVENIVYARAERFIQENNVNNIWGFNVRQTLECLGNKPIAFFIDALEFIADHCTRNTKLEILQELYECAKQYPNAKIITSCRTNDKSAFARIEGLYSVCPYEVSELTSTEQSTIADKYPTIKKMLDMNSYATLLKSPFYINLIVSKISDIDSINDENELREYIWQHIICLNDNEIMKVVESIVFTRAEKFLLGVESKNYPTGTIERLISKSVLVQSDKTVRLKYDIFEDICFEQHLNSEFDKCKGKYNDFFTQIGTLGRCVYRRYQIWISNKLLAQNNREKFLYELVFADKMPQNWRKQTMIGLVKSRHCGVFFSEYGQDIIKNGKLNEFIVTTNLYAFEIVNDEIARRVSYIQLNPIGTGRGCLIQIIIENKLYEQDCIPHSDIIKLCVDYSKIIVKDKQTAEMSCLILEYFVNKHMVTVDSDKWYKLEDILKPLLKPLYQMTEYSAEWIKSFWKTMLDSFKSDNRYHELLAEEIIKDALKFEHSMLTKYLPKELCELAETFWTYFPPAKHPYDYHSPRLGSESQFGLNDNAERYDSDTYRNTPIMSNFFYCLFRFNFWIGLDWAIDFVNKAVTHYSEVQSKELFTYEINFADDSTQKNYLGFPEMWLVATQEHPVMPRLISDLIYCLKTCLRDIIKLSDNESAIKFAEKVTKRIYEKSNNIALLTVIADIGTEFRHKLQGLALDLATNIFIVMHDFSKTRAFNKSPELKSLEDQIFMVMGMSSSMIPDRYKQKTSNHFCLLEYVREAQIYGNGAIKSKSHKILDYLYSIIPNDKENATEYLQIEKMDLRKSKVVKVDDTTIALIPSVSGEAKKLTIESERRRQPDEAVEKLIGECCNNFQNNEFSADDCLVSIEQLIGLIEKCDIPTKYETYFVALLCYALVKDDLNNTDRADICLMLLDGINGYFSAGGINFEYCFSYVLFKQVETDVCDEVKNQIKQLILDLILHEGHNGVISELLRIAKLYLNANTCLAKALFNTIVKLSEDEMNHEKFNASYLKKHRQRDDFEFLPNMQPKLSGVDRFIESDNREIYQSMKTEIIAKYLFNETELDLSDFNMGNHDISVMCHIVNCGLTLNDIEFSKILKKMLFTMIDVWKSNTRAYDAHKILDIYSIGEIRQFLQSELLRKESAENVLEVLFNEVDFSKFVSETLEFYLEVFGGLVSEYFDSHNDKARRATCEKTIRLLETRILAIKEEKSKHEFYKSLTLSITRYGGLGDWNECPSGYVYSDIMFLNEMFKNYGSFHVKEMLHTIYKLHFGKLLPHILLSINEVFQTSASPADEHKRQKFIKAINDSDCKTIILMIITKAFFDFSDEIKADDDLTNAFEEILEILANNNYEEAATILDEFRIH